tara:strand:+ start:3874 stop:5583 length:1710 start_codon:yes stop_codon:yes gene_type:complete
MVTSTRVGYFDPTITTKFGPSGTEEIDALEKGVQLGLQQGSIVARNLQMARRAEIDEKNARQIEEYRQVQRYKLHDGQTEKFNFEDTPTTLDSISNARAEVSTELVKRANELFKARENGDIRPIDYIKGMTILEGQIPLYKTAEETIRGVGEKFLVGVQENNFSNTNDPKLIAFGAALADGSAKIKYNMDNNGVISIDGSFEYDDDGTSKTEKIHVPLTEIQRLANIKYKPKESVSDYMDADVTALKTANEQSSIGKGDTEGLWKQNKAVQMVNGIPTVNKKFKQHFANGFDSYLEQLGEGDDVYQLGQYILDGGLSNKMDSEKILDIYSQKVPGQGGEEAKKFQGKSTMETLNTMFNEHNEKDIMLKDSEGNPISRFDALKNALKEDYILKSAYNYDKSLTDQIESDKMTNLKTTKDTLSDQVKIKELRESLTADSSDSKLVIEKDLEGIINNLANLRDQSIESNKLPSNIQGPTGFSISKNDVKDALSNIGFNITNATDKKGNIIKGQFDVSAPGLDLKEIKGIRDADLTNISQFFKRLVYSQVGINRKNQDEIFTRLNKLIELKKL